MARSDRTAFDDAMDRRRRQMEIQAGTSDPEALELRRVVRREIRRHERRRALAMLIGIAIGIGFGMKYFPTRALDPQVTIKITRHPYAVWAAEEV